MLLSYNPNIPPGSLKELLKQSAYVNPQQVAASVSFPSVDSTYNIHWGYGMLDLYQAREVLDFPVTDITFPSCLPGPAGDNCGGSVTLQVGWPLGTTKRTFWLPPTPVADITTITIRVQNRGTIDAQDVEVTTGVLKEFNAGNVEWVPIT